MKILAVQKKLYIKEKSHKRVSIKGQATVTSIANLSGPYSIQITVVKLLVLPLKFPVEARTSISCVLLSVTEALSQQGQRSEFCEYENVGLSGA